MSQNGEWWRMYLSTSITQNSEGIFCAKGKGDVQYSFQCVSFNLLTSSTIFYCILSWQVFNNHGYSSPSCTCSVSSCCILQRALINRTPVYQHDAGAICSSYQEHQASWDAGAGSRHVSAKPRVLPACGTCAEQLKLSPFALKKANSSACVLILFFFCWNLHVHIGTQNPSRSKQLTIQEIYLYFIKGHKNQNNFGAFKIMS